VLYNAEFANYEHNTTSDDTVIQGRSNLTWHILPTRIQWDMSHERSEQLQDSRNADIRNNKELRNIISGGPTFTAHMGPVNRLILSGRYYDVSYDNDDREGVEGESTTSSGRDNQRIQGTVAWEYQRSKTDVISLNYQHMQSEFDDSSEEFTFDRLFATYAVQLASGGYTVSLGVNESERDSGNSDTGFMARIGWNLNTGVHRFGLNVVNELTDSGIGLGGNSLVSDDFRPSDNNSDIIDMVERTTVAFNYGFDRLCERCTLDFGVSMDEQDYDVQPRDQEQLGFTARFGYKLTPTITASVRAGYSEIDYTNDPSGDRTDERSEYALLFDWRMSRPLSTTLWITWDERDSDTASADYDELAGGLTFRYAFR